jgi:DDE superfamily endonuclease
MLIPTDPLAALRDFRADLYACLGQRRDALFELQDALLSGGPVLSPAHLSLEAVHRRGWGSLDAALAQGEINAEALRTLLARHPLVVGPPIYAVDVSVWPRCDAEASPDRGYYYHPSRHSAGQPIVAGWAYQWIAQLGLTRDSWTAPLDVRRVHPLENTNAVAAAQVATLAARLPTDGPIPIFVFDAGYDPLQLALALGETRAAILVRLRRGRCFYADPVPYAGRGRPRRHGRKFVCDDPTSWPEPANELTEEDEQYGAVRVRAWAGLHTKPGQSRARPLRAPKPVLPGTLILVEVSRLPGRTRKPQVLWLWWHGPGQPNLAVVWRAYVRRFDLEHTFRFVKQILNWTTPRVRHPAQADRWSWLVAAVYTELRLARPVVGDRHLPWERPLPVATLTPYRVRRAFPQLMATLGTPAAPPKPCGRSPGRPKGTCSGPAPRYPALKRTA